MSEADYEAVIGLEVHCQLKTSSKMFTACGCRFGDEPNRLTDPYTLGFPGTLPVSNREAVRSAVALALAVGSTIHQHSRFARKHYFYPDLPKGYQITQSDHPYAVGGCIEIPCVRGDEPPRIVRLIRIHMEEDAGKNIHVPGEDVSLLDFNRAGVPLLEIVSEPDIRSPAEAAAFMRELRVLVRSLGISDANMEEGTLRCDANVSLRRKGSEALGTRCEIKNLNSFKFLDAAITAEIRRQAKILDGGRNVVLSTLTYLPDKHETRIMRTKEEAADYRYFPEPDLPPLVILDEWIDEIRRALPELPIDRRRRYRELGLLPEDIALLTEDPDLVSFFDRILENGADPRKAFAWLAVELLGKLHAEHESIVRSPVDPEQVAEIIALVDDGTLSGRSAKDVLGKCYAECLPPRDVVKRDGYRQVSDAQELEQVIAVVMEEGQEQLERYRSGNVKLRGWFVGQVMKKTSGQANPRVVQQLLERMLPPTEER